jgi:hypothetical protein
MPNRWFTSVRNEIRFNRILNWRGNKILVQPLLYKKWQKKKKKSFGTPFISKRKQLNVQISMSSLLTFKFREANGEFLYTTMFIIRT